MKTITDDLTGFFAQGGWAILEAEGDDAVEEVGEDSDAEEDDYNPEEEGSGEEGSESEYSGEEEDDEDFKDDESESGMNNLLENSSLICFCRSLRKFRIR